MKHATIEMFSWEWWNVTTLCISLLIAALVIAKRMPAKGEKILRVILGISYLLAAILIHPYLMWMGKWSLQDSLPLHFCTLSGILAGIVMLWPRQTTYELLLYWGIPGGINSILTPEFTHGTEGFLPFEYYFLHTGIVLVPLYLTVLTRMRPGKNSWLRILLLTQLAIPIVGTIDWILGANYMYLAQKPIADNPFIIGDWPWYILGLELAVALQFYLIYVFSRLKIPSFTAFPYRLKKT